MRLRHHGREAPLCRGAVRQNRGMDRRGQDRQLRRGQGGRSQNSAPRTLARRPIVAFCSKPPRHLKQNPRRRFEGRQGRSGGCREAAMKLGTTHRCRSKDPRTRSNRHRLVSAVQELCSRRASQTKAPLAVTNGACRLYAPKGVNAQLTALILRQSDRRLRPSRSIRRVAAVCLSMCGVKPT